MVKNSSVNKKLSKTQLLKIVWSGGFLSRLLRALLKTALSLWKNVLKPLAKSVLISLWLTAAAKEVAIYKKMFGCFNTTSIISNTEMNDIVNIIKSLEKSGLLIKHFSEAMKN